jgi:hypothetical protein
MVASAVVVKEIRPERFKDKAFKDAILKAAKAYAKELQKDFEKTTATWETEVEFEQEVDYKPNGPTVLVGTDNEIYGYVNNGTKRHPIFAGIYTGKSNKKVLAFQWGGKGSYKPKTKPRVIGSGPSSISGAQPWRLPYVDHPGFEGRHFDEEIQKQHEPKFKRAMEKAMSDARKASGHAI